MPTNTCNCETQNITFLTREFEYTNKNTPNLEILSTVATLNVQSKQNNTNVLFAFHKQIIIKNIQK